MLMRIATIPLEVDITTVANVNADKVYYLLVQLLTMLR
jgi:hypothetical protein